MSTEPKPRKIIGPDGEWRAYLERALASDDPRAALIKHATAKDDWDTLELGTWGEPDHVLYQRYLTVTIRIPRNGVHRQAVREDE